MEDTDRSRFRERRLISSDPLVREVVAVGVYEVLAVGVYDVLAVGVYRDE